MNKKEFLEKNKDDIAKMISEININNNAAISDYLMDKIIEVIDKSEKEINLPAIKEKLVKELGGFETENYYEEDDTDIDTEQLVYEEDNSYCEDALQLYRKDVEKYQVLTPEQEKELFIRYNNGDQAAKELLINSNLRLVMKIAGRYKVNSIQMLDLIQEGNIGLQTAVERFDVSMGNKLSTYAIWWIKQAIKKAIPDMALQYRIPVHIEQNKWKIIKAEREVYNASGREATLEELSNLTGIDIEEIKRIKIATIQATSIYKTINEDDDTSLGDMIADDKVSVEGTSMQTQLHEEIMKALDNDLTEREKRVIIERYGLNSGSISTLEMVARDQHVTRERIRQIEVKALHKLRRKEKYTGLSEYLD